MAVLCDTLHFLIFTMRVFEVVADFNEQSVSSTIFVCYGQKIELYTITYQQKLHINSHCLFSSYL